jgi:hypothetical protein
MMVDLENYSALDGADQATAQRCLAQVLDSAAEEVGMKRAAWQRQVSGDGELALLPPEEDESIAVGAFPIALDRALREIHRRDGLLLRVRLAVNYGMVEPAALGHAGLGAIDVARIVDAPSVKRALAAVPAAHVILAVAAGLFRDVVRQGRSAARSDQFREVRVDRIEGTAFISIPGVDPARIPVVEEDLTAVPVHQDASVAGGTIVQAGRDVTRSAVGAGSSVTNTDFQGPVRTGHLHIGPRHGR